MSLIKGPKLDRLLAELMRAPTGVVVEMGVHQGGTLAAMALAAPDRRLIGFDTFEGLPVEAWREGELHKVGDFSDTSLEAVRRAVDGLPNVELVPGLFPASADGIEASVALAHVDFDFYESTRAAIEWLLSRMVPGGVIVFDDYEWKYCPGVKRAIEEAGLRAESSHYQAIYRHA